MTPAPMQQAFVNKLLFGYYAATLAFVALDVGLHVNVRLAFLEDAPGWRAAYYAVCIGCAALMHWRPDLSVLIGGVEGVVTITALILSIAPRAMMVAGELGTPIRAEEIINFLISGGFAYISWWRGMVALRRLA